MASVRRTAPEPSPKSWLLSYLRAAARCACGGFSPELAETPSWATCPYVVTVTSREGRVRVSPTRPLLSFGNPQGTRVLSPQPVPGVCGHLFQPAESLGRARPSGLLVEPPWCCNGLAFSFECLRFQLHAGKEGAGADSGLACSAFIQPQLYLSGRSQG